MQGQDFTIARNALLAVEGIVRDALAVDAHHLIGDLRVGPLTKPELAYSLRRMQHAELVYYLRCNASPPVLRTVQTAVQATIKLLSQPDEQLAEDMQFLEPYRHHLYGSVIVAALLASEREDVMRERAFWQTNSMRIA